jgi:hypothetical protein
MMMVKDAQNVQVRGKREGTTRGNESLKKRNIEKTKKCESSPVTAFGQHPGHKESGLISREIVPKLVISGGNLLVK